MSLRWLWLYVRSRRIITAAATATAVTVALWAMWLRFADAETVNTRMVSLTVMLAVAAAGPTLAGPDDALDRSASVRWPLRRLAHLVLAAGAVLALLALTLTTDARFSPFEVAIRNTAGLFGLTALSAAAVGAARSWIVPLAWTLTAMLPMMEASRSTGMQIAAWLIQPAGTTAATVCAAVLAGAGLVAYTLRGGPIHTHPGQP